jgi:hypothetical protein
MKKLIGFLILMVTITTHGSVKVEYRISQLHGLFDFIMSISGEAHHAPGIKKLFDESKFNTPEAQKFLADLEPVKVSLRRSLDFQWSMPDRQGGISVRDLITTQSLFSKDMNELSQRTLGLLPMEDHLRLFETLKYFEPIYSNLIWKTSQKRLVLHKQKLDRMAKKVHLDEMFEKAQTFYRAHLPQHTNFIIGLYPVPYFDNFKNSTNSHSVGTIEEHGVMMGSKKEDIAGSFGVIFHELCHSLYEAQSKEFMKEYEKYFLESKSIFRLQAYNWINEALATTIGNGWASEIANTGKLDEGQWYNQETINGFAKELFPMTQGYLEAKKMLDHDYIDKAIELFGKKFPDSIYSYQSLLNQMIFVYHSQALKAFNPRRLFNESFFISSYENSSPLDDEETVKTIKNGTSTVVIVFKNDDMKALQKLASNFPFLLKNFKMISDMKPKTIFSALDENLRAYLLIHIESGDDLGKAVDALKTIGKIDPSIPVHAF